MTILEIALLLTLAVGILILAYGQAVILRHLDPRQATVTSAWREPAAGALLALLSLWLLWRVRAVLPPFIIAIVLALVLNPLIVRFERRGWPRGRAVLAVFLAFFALMVFVTVWALPIVINQTSDLVASFPSYYNAAQEHIQGLRENRSIQKLPEAVRAPIGKQLQKLGEMIPQGLSVGMNFLLGQLSRVLWLILIPIVTLYLLLELPQIQTGIFRAIPYRYRATVKEVASEVGMVFGHYVRGLILVSASFGAVTAVALTLLGVSYAWALGALAGLLYPVPYIGALTSTALASAIAFFQQQPYSVTRALTAAAALVGTQSIFDNVVWPRVVGGHVGLNPLVSVFAMVVAGELWGVVGVVVAVPLAKSLLVVLSRVFPRLIPPDPELSANAEEEAVGAK